MQSFELALVTGTVAKSLLRRYREYYHPEDKPQFEKARIPALAIQATKNSKREFKNPQPVQKK
jgi:hypothetical protein